MVERPVGQGNCLFKHRVATEAIAHSGGLVASSVEMTREACSLGHADVLALNHLAVTTHAIEGLAPRMCGEVLVMAETDLPVEK